MLCPYSRSTVQEIYPHATAVGLPNLDKFGRNPPLPVRAAIIQWPLPAAACSLRFVTDGISDGQLIVSGANVSSFHWQLNAYRSRCKVKGANGKDRLAALVQDKPP